MADPERLVPMLRRMMLIRAFEERVAELYASGTLYGHVHLYVGEEAVAVGACTALRDDDYVTSTHRGHGHCLAKGAEPRRMMAELFGRRTGYCKGKGGSMHIADFSRGILGANGVVGGGAPAAVGAALGVKLQRRDTVAVCFFGDGAMNQGVLHESMNLAAIWALPVIFVCENNRYAITTPRASSTSGPGAEARGAAYGIPTRVVDGMDVLAVEAAATEAVSRARGAGGPSFLAMETYRFRGHTEGEEALGWNYRPANEIEAWRARDPIARLARHLTEHGTLTTAGLDHLQHAVRTEIDDAVAFAKASPEPELSDVWSDIFA